MKDNFRLLSFRPQAQTQRAKGQMRLQTVNRVGRAKRASPSEKWFAHRARPRPRPSVRRPVRPSVFATARCGVDGGYELRSTQVPAKSQRRQPTECERGRGRMDLEEAFLREMTQTDASADATVSCHVQV